MNTWRAYPAGSPLGPYSCISTSPTYAAALDCSTILIHNLETAADGVNMRDLLDLTGKTAFVTGASSGLGAHFAQLLAKAGAAVTIAARREQALEAVASQIRATGGVCTVAALDISDPNSIAAAEPMLAGVDILLNNAGIALQAALLDPSAAALDSAQGRERVC